MENSVEALKIAFAVFVFVLALTVAFIVLAQAKSTADTVLYHTDKTNFQETIHEGSNIVGVDDLISTLFRYYKESLSVTIRDSGGRIIAIFDTGIEIDCNSTWRTSNEKTIERIKEFVTGSDGDNTDGIVFNSSFDYDNLSNYHYDNRVRRNVLNTTNVCALYDLPTFLNENNRTMQNATFEKTFIEGTVDGEYNTPGNYKYVDAPEGSTLPDDDTTIQITPGSKKVYITYQLTN